MILARTPDVAVGDHIRSLPFGDGPLLIDDLREGSGAGVSNNRRSRAGRFISKRTITTR